ncbi:MAG: hypothetical protein LBO06_04235 [Bacteroidales bacterium]|nr:hypothetical protein [Bacteroidales bacterium]
MKKILLLIVAVIAFAACESRDDCLCEYDAVVHNYIEHYSYIIRDWEGNCDRIDYGDIHLDGCAYDLICREY